MTGLPLSEMAEHQLELAERDWRSNRGASRASEFVGMAVVMGVPERARQAAEYLAREAPSDGAVALARAALSRPGVSQMQMVTVGGVTISERHQIASRKQMIARDPRNAIAWLDLSRLYTTQGMLTPARHAMSVALGLAGGNRFVVRSAVAYFDHLGDADKALAIVRRHPATRRDPWLLAADLAATAAAGRRQVNVRHARSLLESGRFSPLAVSELASELGSMELSSASSKAARRLFATAMIDPTENAAAQAEWAVRSEPQVRTWEDTSVQAGEGAARHAAGLRDWRSAARHAEYWLVDQPFSAAAASFGSYSASLSEDFDGAARLASMGRRANPESLNLFNNYVYSLVELGELATAEKLLSGVVPPAGDALEDVAALAATRGLLAFRQGQADQGLAWYRRAIELARAAKNAVLEAQAWVMLACETFSSGSVDDPTVARAMAAARRVQHPAVDELLDRFARKVSAASGQFTS